MSFLKLEVIDLMPVGDDGDGHHPGIECACGPDWFTDGTGQFQVYHHHFTERTL